MLDDFLLDDVLLEYFLLDDSPWDDFLWDGFFCGMFDVMKTAFFLCDVWHHECFGC